MGPGWMMFRAGYALRRRTGWFARACPPGRWSNPQHVALPRGTTLDEAVAAMRGSRVPFHARAVAARADRLKTIVSAPAAGRLVAQATALQQGLFEFFGSTHRISCPDEWHSHPITGCDWPRRHWSELDDADASDVKWLWEPARFGAAYALVRAFWLTGDAAHAETFWRLVESWRAGNAPNVGVHWMCGQECSYRAIAWIFAMFALLDATASTPARIAMLIEMLAVHGRRIETNLDYAKSQKNNHAVNEGLALWTIGTLLPFLDRSGTWERLGRNLLESEAARQFYDDGAYVQQSLSYHRLVLQSYAWALLIGNAIGRPFSEALATRYARSARLLYELCDGVTGALPNYGANDGAALLRLHDDDSDARPTIGLAFWAAKGRRAFPPGPADEPSFWLAGAEALDAAHTPLEHTDLAADVGGYYTLREGDSWGFTRCAAYRDRPSHADMLHVDLWWRGENIIGDPGTYAYTGAPPWANGLASTAVHNTPTVDGLDQMERLSRFAWTRWNRGRVVRRDVSGAVKIVEAEHDGYLRRCGVLHRRAVLLLDGRAWIVVDDLLGAGTHRLSAQWLLPRAGIEGHAGPWWHARTGRGLVALAFFSFSAGVSGARLEVSEPSEHGTLGWVSTTYGSRQRAAALVVSETSELPVRRITAIVPGESAPAIEMPSVCRCALTLDDRQQFEIALRPLPYAHDASLVESCISF